MAPGKRATKRKKPAAATNHVVTPLKRKPKELKITLTYEDKKFKPHRAVRVREGDTIFFEFSTDMEKPKMTITFQDKKIFRPAIFESGSLTPVTVEKPLKKRSRYDCEFSGIYDGKKYRFNTGTGGAYGGWVDP